MLWQLFITFVKMGFISFGGGYAVLPMIEHEVSSQDWLTTSEFQEAIALAGMAPGPIATNSATLIGYQTAGLTGALASTVGIILPSLILIILVSALFYRIHDHKLLKSSFYGLRPIVTGLIIYAAIHFGFLGQSEQLFSWTTLATLIICAGSIYAILKYKLHPFTIIILSGAAGIVFF
ncbi:chromate transporter [Paenibacillus abyssi]|uniref:Chromate transporter n=1 Tax=Paenibacillus abyssi TaxID=1340531 RepID=A0A917LEQ0_9BACL|nr:chromate transporter [Paenibacillus abyssi]GGG16070.1 chromate transporter [Paenibacillus abyssi]